MTKAQQRKINMIRKQAENLHGVFSNDYEIKEWKIEECGFFISLVVEVGLKGDEGTLASIYGRDRLQVFIGKKGGARIPLYKKNKNTYKQFKKMTYGDNNKVNA